MSIIITSAKPEDSEGIQEVFFKTWLDVYPNEEFGITLDDIQDRYKNALTAEGIAKREKFLVELGPNKKFFVAKDDVKVIGLCVAVLYPEKNQLEAIYILPAYQGKGIGKLLWEEAMKFFDPQKETMLEVVTYNAKAIAFYEKLGFKDTGRRFTEDKFRMKSGSILPEMEMRRSEDV
jgi:ribosomal protein S18 acetylase RimI-like enzyme